MARRDPLELNRDSGSNPESRTAKNRTTEHETLNPMQLNYYKPEYKTLNYTTWNTDVSGQVNYANTIAKFGEKHLNKIKKTEENLKLANTYIDINSELRNKSQEFKKTSPSGEGYLEYISNLHNELNNRSLSGIFDPELSGKMKEMLLRSKADWENSAFKDEQTMRSAFTLRESQKAVNDICTNMINTPSSFDSGMVAIGHALESYREVAGEQAFAKVFDETKSNYTYAYGMGLVQQDPANFDSLTKDVRFDVLTPKQLNSLKKLANSEVSRRENQLARNERNIEHALNEQGRITSINLETQMVERGAKDLTDVMIENSGLTPRLQAQLKLTRAKMLKAEEKNLAIENKMEESINNGYGLGGFKDSEQLAYLNDRAIKKNGEPYTPRQKILYANRFGITATDKFLTNELVNTAKLSQEPAKVLQALDDVFYASSLNSKLVNKEAISKDDQFILDHMRYNGAGKEDLTVAAREEAIKQVEKMNLDPKMKEAFSSQADKFTRPNDKEFIDLTEKKWKEVEKELDLKDDAPVLRWKPDDVDTQRTDNFHRSKAFFKGYFQPNMRSYMRMGYNSQIASEKVVNNFLQNYGEDTFVTNTLMYKPPAREYPHLDSATLINTFNSYSSELVNSYSDKKISSLGLTVSMAKKNDRSKAPIVSYSNGVNLNGKSPVYLTWNSDANAYNLYFKVNGTDVYLPNKYMDDLAVLEFDQYIASKNSYLPYVAEKINQKNISKKQPRVNKKQDLRNSIESDYEYRI